MFKIIISPVVFCGCETWCQTSREEYYWYAECVREQGAEEKFEPNQDKMAGDWRKLHNENDQVKGS
jgi:hypothetical protein